MSLYDEIRTGLQQAIDYEKGTLKAKTNVISIVPIEVFSAKEIKAIRKKTGLTQALFAKYLGISLKTVEAWEAGRNQPSGPACRLLALTKKDPHFPQNSGIMI